MVLGIYICTKYYILFVVLWIRVWCVFLSFQGITCVCVGMFGRIPRRGLKGLPSHRAQYYVLHTCVSSCSWVNTTVFTPSRSAARALTFLVVRVCVRCPGYERRPEDLRRVSAAVICGGSSPASPRFAAAPGANIIGTPVDMRS